MRRWLLEVGRLCGTALGICAVWLCTGFFFASQNHTLALARRQPDSFGDRMYGMAVSVLAWAFFTPLIFFVAERLPLRRPHLLRRAAYLLLFAVAVGALRAMLDGWLRELFKGVPLTFLDLQPSVVALFHTHLLFVFLLIGIAHYRCMQREEKARREAEARMESELAAARLRQLSADLQPHFLFNALHGVAALLHRDAAAAEEMLRKLRQLLSASVESGAAREVPLSRELEMVERYFDIQKMRFGDKLSTAIELEDARLEDAAVPPLLLQPLVENSIIHGIKKRRDGGSVTVAVDADGEWLRLQVRDSGPGCDPATIFDRGHIGVPNARARLVSMYGDRQSFVYAHRAGEFVAEVRIPLRLVEVES
ncbi:MAG TPA: histidine kinase [Thermoanaerobaculia bacterium]